MGNPQDRLRAFIFKVDDKAPMWIPYESHFISQPVNGTSIANNPAGIPVTFTFDPPISMHEGAFSVVVYRDGKPSDQDFYRIYADVLGRVE